MVAAKHFRSLLSNRRNAGAPLSKGFTLIELMVVLVLIGILSAMILPEMKGTFGDALLRSSGRELVNVFSLAYSQAVSRNELHRVRIETSTGRYITERRMGGEAKQTQFQPLKEVAGSSGKLDNRIVVEIRKQNEVSAESTTPEPGSAPAAEFEGQGQENAIVFYPDGTADAAEVQLRDQAGFGLRLRINPITARVEILELARE